MNTFIEREYAEFRYQAWGSVLTCLLRVRVFATGELAVFVSDAHQAPRGRHTGSRITENIEVIFSVLLRTLLVQGLLPDECTPKLRKFEQEAINRLAGRSRVVQCSLEGDDFAYAVVNLANGGASWSYLAREDVASLDGIDAGFIDPRPSTPTSTATAVDPALVDDVFASLRAAGRVLAQGRSLGFQVAVGDPLRTALVDRHGQAASDLLANCRPQVV